MNLYAEIVETGEAKDIGALYGTPGKDLLAVVGNGPQRGSEVLGALSYVVSGNQLFSVDAAYNATLLGVLATTNGPVSIISNPTQIMVVDGVQGYVWDTGTNLFTADVLNGIVVGPNVLCYQDGFGIVNSAGTMLFFQSNLNNFLVWDPLNFSSADGQPGPIVSAFDSQREVWLFKSTTTEVWINAGLPGFTFQRLSGVFLQQGCAAPFSPARVGGAVCWLGQNEEGAGIVYMQQGYTGIPISTHAITREIQSYITMADAIGFAYQQDKHDFYFLTFPTAGKTWVYDKTASDATGVPMWHERAYFLNGVFSRDLANSYMYFNGKNIVGDYQNGNLYALNLNTFQDNGQPIKRLRSWRAMKKDANIPMRFNQLELDCQTGVNIPQDANPIGTLRWSDDGGYNWSNEVKTALGKQGETSRRVMWTRMGQTRRGSGLDRTFEFSHSENIPSAYIGADLDAEPA